MGRLDGKAAIITGGEGSIGMATARALTAEGASVFLAGLSEPGLKAGAAELGARSAWMVTDVTDSAQVKAAVDAAVERFGRLDIVIANAGIKGATSPIASYPEDSFDQSLAVHVRGAFLLARHAVPYLSSGASIIFTSSVVGLTAAPHIAGYSTAKHAQVGLMRCLAKELAPRNIRVNTVHPGPIDNAFQLNVEKGLTNAIGRDGTDFFNEIIPLHRHGTAEEIARAVLFLASDQSSFTTGALLMADGGMSA